MHKHNTTSANSSARAKKVKVTQHGLNHTFSVDLAMELGSIDLAILTHYLQFWIRHNAALGKNFLEGRTWMYETASDIAAVFPYWSSNVVQKMLQKLVKMGILLRNNFNKTPFDRTSWYAFEDEKKFAITRFRRMDASKRLNQFREVSECTNTDTVIETDIETEREGVPPSPPAPASSFQKIPRGKNVETTEEEHADLVSEFGEERVSKMYDRLSDWKENTPRSKWKLNDHITMRGWVRDAVLEDESHKGKKEVDIVAENKASAQRIESSIADIARSKGVTVSAFADCVVVTIQGWSGSYIVKYSEKGFREQLENILRKVGVL